MARNTLLIPPREGRKRALFITVGEPTILTSSNGYVVWPRAFFAADVTTVAKVKDDLRGWQLTRCLFVGDGERRRRYAVCFNHLEAKRQKAHREELLGELEAELAGLSDLAKANHTKRVCALRTSPRYGRLLKETKHGLVIDRQAVTELERFDGKFVVHSNDDTLTAEDMALGYKQQQRVEEAWRTMKSGLRMRPVFHWAPHRIYAHIAISVLSLLLERTAEHACQATWRNIRDDLKQIQLALLSSPNGRVWQVTEPSIDAANRLKRLNLKPPKPILDLD